jgi:hypothetical protein
VLESSKARLARQPPGIRKSEVEALLIGVDNAPEFPVQQPQQGHPSPPIISEGVGVSGVSDILP